MKSVLVSVILLATFQLPVVVPGPIRQPKPKAATNNVFIITTDGFRWQELFTGADSLLINNENYTPDTETMKMLFWSATANERRKKLLPFFWNILSQRGQVYGNRHYNNDVNVDNNHSLSYPGYNEMFTGTADPLISSNRKVNNPNINILEYLNNQEAYHGKVAAFTSWDVFPFILNEKRSKLQVNSGYENITDDNLTITQQLTNKVQDETICDKTATRHDRLTFIAAKEYIQKNQPKVLYLGLGETDEFAHDGRYDLYLQQANEVDRMIAELWHMVQTTPGYKDNTIFIITTDHGRGSKTHKWTSHGAFIKGSSQTWLAVIGPGIQPLGEVKDKQQLYQKQLATTIAGLLGENFETVNTVASAIPLPRNKKNPDAMAGASVFTATSAK